MTDYVSRTWDVKLYSLFAGHRRIQRDTGDWSGYRNNLATTYTTYTSLLLNTNPVNRQVLGV